MSQTESEELLRAYAIMLGVVASIYTVSRCFTKAVVYNDMEELEIDPAPRRSRRPEPRRRVVRRLPKEEYEPLPEMDDPVQ